MSHRLVPGSRAAVAHFLSDLSGDGQHFRGAVEVSIFTRQHSYQRRAEAWEILNKGCSRSHWQLVNLLINTTCAHHRVLGRQGVGPLCE